MPPMGPFTLGIPRYAYLRKASFIRMVQKACDTWDSPQGDRSQALLSYLVRGQKLESCHCLILYYSCPNGGFRASLSIRSLEQGFLQVLPVVDSILRVERLQYTSGGLRRLFVYSTAGNGKNNALALGTFDFTLKPQPQPQRELGGSRP